MTPCRNNFAEYACQLWAGHEGNHRWKHEDGRSIGWGYVNESRLVVTGNTVTSAPSGSVTLVPNQPKTPRRTFRISDELYEAAQTKAETNGETVSDVVRRALEQYIADNPKETS